MLSQNCQLKRLVHQYQVQDDLDNECREQRTKRKRLDGSGLSGDSGDEGLGNMSPTHSTVVEPSQHLEQSSEELKREMIELRIQLDRERKVRLLLEEENRNLNSQIYPEKIRKIAQDVQLHFQVSVEKRKSS